MASGVICANEKSRRAGSFNQRARDYGLTVGCAVLLAASTAAAALFASSTGLVVFIASVFIASVFIAESVFIASIFIESVEDVVEGAVVVAGAGAGTGVGAGVAAGAGAGAGGAGSFLPQAASATTIIEASNSDLFILYEPFMVIR